MKKIFSTKTSQETIEVGRKVGALLKAGDVLLLVGDLSAGKTTFTKGIGLALNIKKVINSPTFTIVKEYQGTYPLYHLDLYRLDGLNEDFDLEEYIEGDGICVIEWPYQVQELLPNHYLKIELKKTSENGREINIQGVGARYEGVVDLL
ncbi:MAG: tRNA (adenosine(37)-N6)-threonylcarbamoyltransferase complex ATPase subunit type 1 TsaE [Anaeroplasmataceae bacterium]|nr:tRNA (adenosine(37)-N6)-threonylcarbamoyltransferase complex ATPase subunit type 1 TsaE [Anaeroplasmataceae bacterium]